MQTQRAPLQIILKIWVGEKEGVLWKSNLTGWTGYKLPAGQAMVVMPQADNFSKRF